MKYLKLEVEASLGNPFRVERPQRRQIMRNGTVCPRCMAGPHVAVSAHKHAVPPLSPLPPLPPLPPAVAALGSLAAPAAAPAASAAAGLVPGQECMMLTISQGVFIPANGLAGLAAKKSGPLQLEILAVREHAKYPRKCAASVTDATICFSSR